MGLSLVRNSSTGCNNKVECILKSQISFKNLDNAIIPGFPNTRETYFFQHLIVHEDDRNGQLSNACSRLNVLCFTITNWMCLLLSKFSILFKKPIIKEKLARNWYETSQNPDRCLKPD